MFLLRFHFFHLFSQPHILANEVVNLHYLFFSILMLQCDHGHSVIQLTIEQMDALIWPPAVTSSRSPWQRLLQYLLMFSFGMKGTISSKFLISYASSVSIEKPVLSSYAGCAPFCVFFLRGTQVDLMQNTQVQLNAFLCRLENASCSACVGTTRTMIMLKII